LLSAEIAALFCPPLALEVADLVIMTRELLGHLQGEGDTIERGNVRLEMLTAGRPVTCNGEILGWSDDDEHWFLGRDVLGLELFEEIQFCLLCHDDAPPGSTRSNRTTKPEKHHSSSGENVSDKHHRRERS
jgi:hypothetical protein